MPHLLGHLAERGIVVDDVRIPPAHRPIDADMAEKLIRSVWFERLDNARPDKFVVLLDADRKRPDAALAPIRATLPARLGDIHADVQFACAQQHLEAWYFADAKGLARHLGRDLSSVDASQPDAIENPKRHLKHLLGSRPYASLASQAIAAGLNAAAIADRSPSFRGFVTAVENGGAGKPA